MPTEQLLLFATPEEQLLLEQSPRFRTLDEYQRRFALAWLQQALDHRRDPRAHPLSAASVGARAGIGRTKAAELARDPEVLMAIRQAGQAHSDLADVHGSVALDLVVRGVLQRLADGRWTPSDVPPHLVRELAECKRRLGLLPGTAGVSLAFTDAAGNQVSVSAGVADGGDHLDELLTKLRQGARVDGRRGAGAEGAEVVRVEPVAESAEGAGEPVELEVEIVAAGAGEKGAAA